jgi:hypothetical protein
MIFPEEDVKRIWKRLKKFPNVVAFDNDFQPRIKNGQIVPNTKVFRIYVSKKLPKSQLAPEDVLPQYLFYKINVDSTLEHVETDVVEIGVVKALVDDPKKKYRPVKAGVSACHVNCTACTLTGFFRDKDTGQFYIGLNNHCGALENKASVGDLWIQPSPYDGGTVNDAIARLHHFVEVKFNGFKCPFRNAFHRVYKFIKRDIPLNKVDISFGTPLNNDFEVSCLNIPTAFCSYREPNVGDKVQKNGRTTGLTTEGEVVSTSWTGTVQYSRGIATFTDCILIHKQGFSAGGDSGSPIFDMDGNWVGVLFAGSDEYTIACKLSNIMKEGNVTIVTNIDNFNKKVKKRKRS